MGSRGRRIGPAEVALARAIESIDESVSLPGGTTWEPKWDGYRLLADRRGDGVTLWSRRGTDLTRAFPDVAGAVAEQLPPGVLVDGEVVVWADGRLDFSALQRRVASLRTAARQAAERPASYVAFDLLVAGTDDLRGWPLRQRRAVLEELAAHWRPPMTLSPATDDIDIARGWFRDLAVAGVEGLVAKGAAQPYPAGRRDWLKIKQRSVLDVVCAAVIGPIGQPAAVVAGLPIDGELRIVGRTVPLTALASRTLAREIRPAVSDHPWPEVVTSAAVSGFGGGGDPVRLTRIEPVVVEVSADVAWSGRSFRHPLRFVRARIDVDPAEVDVDPVLRRS